MRLVKFSIVWWLTALLLLSCAAEQQQQLDQLDSMNERSQNSAANDVIDNENTEDQNQTAVGNESGNGGVNETAEDSAEINNATEADNFSQSNENQSNDLAEDENLLGEVSNEVPQSNTAVPLNPAMPPANIANHNQVEQQNAAVSQGAGNSAVQTVSNGNMTVEGSSDTRMSSEPVMAEEFTELASEDVRPSSNGLLSWVGYKFDRKEKLLKIEIITRGRPQYEVFLEKNRAIQPELVVRFFETGLRPKIKRDIDASEFKSPVSYVRMREDENNRHTDVVITTRDPLKPRLFAKDGNLLLTYEVPEKYLGSQEEMQAQIVGQAVPLAGLMPDLESSSDAPIRVATADVLVAFPDPAQGALPEGESGGQLFDEAIGAEQKTDAKGLPGNFGVEEDLAPIEEATPAIDSDGQEFEFKPDGASTMSFDGMRFVIVRALSIGAVAAAMPLSAAEKDGSICRAGTCLAQLDAAVPEAFMEDTMNVPSNVQANAPVDPGNSPAEVGDIEGQEQENNVEAKSYTGRPIAIEFFNTPLREVLNVISEESGNNFVYKDTIGATNITIKLRDVPWDEALNAILETYGLGMARVGPKIVRVDTLRELVTSLEQINQSKKVEALSAPTRLMTVRLSHAKAATIAPTVQNILNTAIQAATMETLPNNARSNVNLSVVADDRTNSLVVQAPVTFLARAKALIERLDIETPQIEIASRIVEVNRQGSDFLGFSFSTALNYDAGRALSFGSLNFPNSFRSGFAVDPNVVKTESNSTTTFTFGSINNFINLDAILKMEERRGTSNILQSNRVVVLDRQKASINAGTSQYFRRLADTTSAQGATTQNGGSEAAAAAGGGGIDKVDFNLSMDVTPEVAADGLITMQVNVSTSNPSAPTNGQAAAGSSRSVATRMALRSSDTAVIGGIYDTKKVSSVSGIPFLMDLPIIGALFRSTSQSESQIELLVFLTPTLVNPGSQKAQSSDFEKEAAVVSPVASNAALNQTAEDNFENNMNSNNETAVNQNENGNSAMTGNGNSGANGNAEQLNNSANAPVGQEAPSQGNSGQNNNTFDDSLNAPQQGDSEESI